ncbi:MAG: hypothetical protein H6736_04105 [Alphaproteobacteria bacterium]|nr:hypothetical protein [Alphaproteobacteria bacterium]MCB9690977.1 hypothetical protein [Alphaproteobacteria bacterium]
MSQATTLLRDVLDTIRTGNVPDPDALVAVEAQIQAAGPDLSRAELHELLGLVNEVQEALVQEKQVVQAELDRLSVEKRAIRGYANLRSHRHSQRVNRKT